MISHYCLKYGMINLIIVKYFFEFHLNDSKLNLDMTDLFNINKCKSKPKIAKIECLCISDLKRQFI